MSSFYSEEELKNIGFKSYGYNVKISRNTCIYKPDDIEIGNNVRIDDFCFLLGKIRLGSYIHIAPYSNLCGGKEGITMENFSGVSSRVSIYATSDDYSGVAMTNPTVPDKFTNVISSPVLIKKHAIVGASSVVLPGVTIEEGTSCGAMTLVNRNTEPWSIYVGAPAKKIANRSKELLSKEQAWLKEVQDEIVVGAHREFTQTVLDENVRKYAEVSGDFNPIHLDEKVAENSIFKKKIAHGMLIVSYISAYLGNEFPGNGTIYLGENIRFLKPIYIGTQIRLEFAILDIDHKNDATIKTDVYDQNGEKAIDGIAYVKLPQKG